MRFVVLSKYETEYHYTIELGNRFDETRYTIDGGKVCIRKDAKFGEGLPTPQEDNRRWFDSIAIGAIFELKPQAPG